MKKQIQPIKRRRAFARAPACVLLAWLAFGSQAARAAANYEPYTFTHFAGSFGGIGYSDGTGSAARFNNPSAVAVDSSNNLYVADADNNTIRNPPPGAPSGSFGGGTPVTNQRHKHTRTKPRFTLLTTGRHLLPLKQQ